MSQRQTKSSPQHVAQVEESLSGLSLPEPYSRKPWNSTRDLQIATRANSDLENFSAHGYTMPVSNPSPSPHLVRDYVLVAPCVLLPLESRTLGYGSPDVPSLRRAVDSFEQLDTCAPPDFVEIGCGLCHRLVRVKAVSDRTHSASGARATRFALPSSPYASVTIPLASGRRYPVISGS